MPVSGTFLGMNLAERLIQIMLKFIQWRATKGAFHVNFTGETTSRILDLATYCLKFYHFQRMAAMFRYEQRDAPMVIASPESIRIFFEKFNRTTDLGVAWLGERNKHIKLLEGIAGTLRNFNDALGESSD